MASRYSLSASLPATRKSIHRAQSARTTIAADPEQQQQADVSTPGLGLDEKIAVAPHEAWTSTPVSSANANATDATVRRDLTIRKGATRSGSKNKSETAALKSEFDSLDATYDERGYLVLKSADIFGLTPSSFTENKSNDEGRTRANRLAYLEGLRGILGIQVLLWTFFRIFAPAIVADRDIDGVYPAAFLSVAPAWQSILRKVLSPLLFDGELQASFFIILSGRASLQTFIERRQALPLAGAAFKRPFRFLIPMAITVALVSLVIAVDGFRHASLLSISLSNQLASPPAQFSSALEYWNSLFFFFSTPTYYKIARATTMIPPSGTLWIIPVLFQQTYVLIILAFTLPFTVLRYKNMGMILLILTTAWVGRFSWYTLTGLLIAEWSTVYRQVLPGGRIPLNRAGTRFVPAWVPGAVFAVVGVIFKYLWIAGLPADAQNEIVAHVDGNTGKLNYGVNPAQVAFPRYDNWLVATGILYLIELSPRAQRSLSTPVLKYIGRWAFSISLISGTLMLSLGSLLRYHLTASLGWTSPAAILAVLFAALIPASLVVVEVYARLVDDAALWVADWLFRWIRV